MPKINLYEKVKNGNKKILREIGRDIILQKGLDISIPKSLDATIMAEFTSASNSKNLEQLDVNFDFYIKYKDKWLPRRLYEINTNNRLKLPYLPSFVISIQRDKGGKYQNKYEICYEK